MSNSCVRSLHKQYLVVRMLRVLRSVMVLAVGNLVDVDKDDIYQYTCR